MEYNAPKPTLTKSDRNKAIALRVLFPPTLVWDALKFGFNKLFGKLIGSLILPAQNMKFDSHVNREAFLQMQVESLTVNTYDGASLDTLEIQPNNLKSSRSCQKHIIHLLGNAESYQEQVDEMIDEANKLRATVIGFDFRGVNQSTGRAKSSLDLVTDGIAQVQRLLDNGVKPENITLKGHSLGAGVAALVAKHFHQHGQPINIFSGRSFSNITNFAVGHIRLSRKGTTDDPREIYPLGQKETLGRKFFGWLLKPFIKFFLLLFKWEINAGDAFKSIPKTHREYTVIRSQKDTRDNSAEDFTIPHYASIHNALKDERALEKKVINSDPNASQKESKNIQRKQKNNNRKIHLTQNLNATQASKVDEMLKVFPEQLPYKGVFEKKLEQFPELRAHLDLNLAQMSHGISLSKQTNRNGQNAQKFFETFVEQAYQDHGFKTKAMTLP